MAKRLRTHALVYWLTPGRKCVPALRRSSRYWRCTLRQPVRPQTRSRAHQTRHRIHSGDPLGRARPIRRAGPRWPTQGLESLTTALLDSGFPHHRATQRIASRPTARLHGSPHHLHPRRGRSQQRTQSIHGSITCHGSDQTPNRYQSRSARLHVRHHRRHHARLWQSCR